MKAVFLLASVFGLASCSLAIKGVCIKGPAQGKAIAARASYNGFGSGKITAVAPWGEKAEGRYQTNIGFGSASTGAWRNEITRSKTGASEEGDDVVIRSDAWGNTQVGTALLIGDQGTAFDVIYWGSGWSPLHGQGRAKDTRGNYYRLVW